MRIRIMKVLLISLIVASFATVKVTVLAFGEETGFVKVSAGNNMTVALKADGSVWMWGYLGSINTDYRCAPVKVPEISGVKDIVARDCRWVAIKDDGTVWTGGFEVYDQLGNVTVKSDLFEKPIQVTGLTDIKKIGFTLALREDGTVWTWDYKNINTPIQLEGLSDIKDIAGYDSRGMAVKEDGTLWMWGDFGLEDTSSTPKQVPGIDKVKKVSLKNYFPLVLKEDKTVWTFKDNDKYWNVEGNIEPEIVPVKIEGIDNVKEILEGDEHTVVLKEDGTVYGWGSNEYNKLGLGPKGIYFKSPQLIEEFGKVKQVSAGRNHTMALNEDGRIIGIGNNSYGELGNGVFGESNVPVKFDWHGNVKEVHSSYDIMILNEDGELWNYEDDSPVLTGVKTASYNGSFTAAVMNDGTVMSWGWNGSGQLGDGTKTDSKVPVKAIGIDSVKAIATSNISTVALREDGTLWKWGQNTLIPQKILGIDNVKEIACGYRHIIALKEDGTVWTMGSNQYGQLGNGTTVDSSTPVLVSSLSNIKSIAAVDSVSMALDKTGYVYAWGINGFMIAGNHAQNNYIPVKVRGVDNIKNISIGRNSSFPIISAVKNDGSVLVWGGGIQGELGNGRIDGSYSIPENVVGISGVKTVFIGEAYCIAQKEDGTLWSWGGVGNITGHTISKYPSQVTDVDDANLKYITINNKYVESFKKDVTEYEAFVSNQDLADVLVKGGLSNPNATINITQAESIPGTAKIEVTALNGARKTYSIKLMQEIPNNSFKTAILIKSTDKQIPGTIEVGEEADYFKFVPQTSEVYTFESTGSMDALGEVYGLNNEDINKPLFYSINNDISKTNTNFRISLKLTAGKSYFIKIRHFNNGIGNYKIKVYNWFPMEEYDESKNDMFTSDLVDMPSNINTLEENPNGNPIKDTDGSIKVSSRIDNYGGDKWYKLPLGSKYGAIFALLKFSKPEGTIITDLDLELYEVVDNKLMLLDYSASYKYDEFIYYPLSANQINSEFIIRVRNNNKKPGTLPLGFNQSANMPYNFDLEFKMVADIINGGEYAGWKKNKDDLTVNFTDDNPAIVQFNRGSYDISQYFDEVEKIKYIDLIKYAISIWNDAKWRYELYNIKNEVFKRDVLFALDETNSLPVEEVALKFHMCYDPNSSAIANSVGMINTAWFKKDILEKQKLTQIIGNIGNDNLPTIEDLAKRLFVHEMGHKMGLYDLYGSPQVYQDANIDNRAKLMFGIAGYWDIRGINRYNYLSYLNIKDIEGLCKVNNIWTNDNESFIYPTYIEVTKEELYKNSDMIIKVKVKETKDSTSLQDYSQITLEVQSYYKDTSKSYSKEINILQEGNSSRQYFVNPLLGSGEEVVLFLRKGSDGSLYIMGGPQGRFDIAAGADSKVYIENHLAKITRESIQSERRALKEELGVNISDVILPDTLLEGFEATLKEALKGYTSSGVSGYVSADIIGIPENSALKSGFKIEMLGTDISTQSMADGFFKLDNIPQNLTEDIIRISKKGYLYRDIKIINDNNDVNQTGTKQSPVLLWLGDINADDSINMHDVMMIAKTFNSNLGEQNYLEECDLNKDGSINMADVLIIAKHFNSNPMDYTI